MSWVTEVVPSSRPRAPVGTDTLDFRFPQAAREGTLGQLRVWLADPWAEHPAAAFAKRALDIVLAALLLLLTAPLQLLAALLVRLTSKGPAIFVQRRIGYRCRQFGMYKLRTMVADASSFEETLAEARQGGTFFKIEKDPRTTALGRVLRKLSIDELPQLYNVLKGDMSLVGPRPLLICDFQRFPRQEQMRRFSVKPGLTGLWQVGGRSRCSDQRRIELDLEYVRRRSFWLDLGILAKTIPVVLSGRGAY